MSITLVRNAAVEGRVVDIAIAAGRIVEIGPRLKGEELFDARGSDAIAGLHDHHIHLLATAALRESVQLDRCANAAALADALRQADASLPQGRWLRATGYHERIAGPLDRDAIDQLVPHRPVRVQHQTGGLWMLNGAALATLGTQAWPAGTERDSGGRLTGRFFRCDTWLSERIGRTLPDLGTLGRELASYGVTGVTDASVSTDAETASLLDQAVMDGRLPLQVTLMSGGPLALPCGARCTIGPVKILLDDDRLPALDAITATIAAARAQGRRVAAHCVTAGELAVMLAAFEEAGTCPGDRIEHGSIIPAEAVRVLRDLGLTVVSQPGFVASRGDRYRALVEPAEQPDLYRIASLMAAGVPVGGSSDAPYGNPEPWHGIAAAVSRRSEDGHVLGIAEALTPARALALYQTPADVPGGEVRRIEPGAPADLCVLGVPLEHALAAPKAGLVAATICAGAVTYRA